MNGTKRFALVAVLLGVVMLLAGVCAAASASTQGSVGASATFHLSVPVLEENTTILAHGAFPLGPKSAGVVLLIPQKSDLYTKLKAHEGEAFRLTFTFGPEAQR